MPDPSHPSSHPSDDFLFPKARYRGHFSPEELAFNANLQEFAQRVDFICALETGGKLSAREAYQQIRDLWQALMVSKANLLGEGESAEGG